MKNTALFENLCCIKNTMINAMNKKHLFYLSGDYLTR